ncbi:MAG: hypothetical protein JHC82_00240 [Stenotrophomonas sp.]|nr:hypothetical protein [Stenotrophomonas sp.]
MKTVRIQRSKTPGRCMTPSMKTLALIAFSLSICISLTGCIAPFRVKARAYATADSVAALTPDSPPPATPQ